MNQPSRADDVEYVNCLVVTLTQALIGLVSPALLAAALDWTEQKIVLYFAIAEHSAEQDADIDEVVGDFEAYLYPKVPPLDVRVSVGNPSPDWPGDEHARQVFRVKL